MNRDLSQFEQLSAWMDNGSDMAIPEKLLSDGNLSQAWQRYHLIGDIMRKEVSPIDHDSLTAAIHERLSQEPTILAPRAARAIKHPQHNGWMRWAAGMGMAASVAALVIVGVTRMEQQGGVQYAQSPQQSADQAPMTLAAAPQSAENGRFAAPSAVDSRINRYLTDHSKFVASGGSLNAMVPLMTLVSHNE